jgi:hypothetical protein
VLGLLALTVFGDTLLVACRHPVSLVGYYRSIFWPGYLLLFWRYPGGGGVTNFHRVLPKPLLGRK